MLFTVYLDEADTHGPSPTIIMTAMLGSARQWQLFERKLRKLQREEEFKVFHGKEIKAFSGEFKGWSDRRGRRVVMGLTRLIRDELTAGMSIHLDYESYVKIYRNSFTPRGVNLDSQYGVCFRLLLIHIVNTLSKTRKQHKLHVVLEQGHKNAKNCENIFDEAKETLRAMDHPFLGDFTLARKEEAPPLMVADLLAHSYMILRRPDAPVTIDQYLSTARLPRKREAGWEFLEVNVNTLPNLKLQMQQDRLIRLRYAQRQKVEVKASTPLAAPSGEQSC